MSRPGDSGSGNPIITMFLFRRFCISNQSPHPESRRASPCNRRPYQRRRVRAYPEAARPRRKHHHFSTPPSNSNLVVQDDGLGGILGTEQKESEDTQQHSGEQPQIYDIACVTGTDSSERNCSAQNMKKSFTSDSQTFEAQHHRFMPYQRPLSTFHPAFRNRPTEVINKHQDDQNTTQRCEESPPPPLPPRPLVGSPEQTPPPMAPRASSSEIGEQSPDSANNTAIVASTEESIGTTAVDSSEDVPVHYDNTPRPPCILWALHLDMWGRRGPEFDWDPRAITRRQAKRCMSRSTAGNDRWVTGKG
ncbi:MAG: hypothetical protein Q9173_001898 [Seirophora scorigena]